MSILLNLIVSGQSYRTGSPLLQVDWPVSSFDHPVSNAGLPDIQLRLSFYMSARDLVASSLTEPPLIPKGLSL